MAATANPVTRSRLLIGLSILPVLWVFVAIIVARTRWSARIYDAFIVSMTSSWYKAVFLQLPQGTALLDVGVGTASALLSNAEEIRSKELTILGLDIHMPYIQEGQRAITEHELQHQVHVTCLSIYDSVAVEKWVEDSVENSRWIDAVYFSGSFSVLPDPLQALLQAKRLLRPGGVIYIAQTYASSVYRLGQVLKPLLRHATTIDFGRLITTTDVMRIFAQSNLTVVRHEQLNLQKHAFGLSPPSFLSILQVPRECDDDASRSE